MRRIFTTIVFLFYITEINAQAGLWTWVNGDTACFQNPVFGIQGIADSLNHPTGAYEGCEWTDNQGNFWFYEGISQIGWGSNLWKYQPTINMWTWIKGTTAVNDTGNYGVQGVSSPSNLPPGRGFGIATWVDTSGYLWMYGGANTIGGSNTFSDLWKYNISSNEWTWIGGSTQINQSPVFGIKGVASPLNTPGALSEAVCTWTDNTNNLWLFGGADAGGQPYNALWKYSISSNEWTWMKGTDTINSVGVYSVKGQEDSLNTPSGRFAYSRWKDNNDNFWLFGGRQHGSGYMNDLWKYNLATNNWAWMKGPINAPLDTGVTGNECDLDTSFNPICRFENRSCWKDINGNFWMFGGWSFYAPYPYAYWLNDLWMYEIATDQWILVWQDSTYYHPGNFGVKGIPSPCNKPPGRVGSVSWYNSNTNSMYLFGGHQQYGVTTNCWRSSMWRYEIDITCTPHHCSQTGISDLKYSDELIIFPNPTNSILTVSAELSKSQQIALKIYNLLAEEIYSYNEYFIVGKFSKEINLKDYSNGIYFLQLQAANKIIYRKIVKQ